MAEPVDKTPIQSQKRVAVVKGPDQHGMYFVGFSAGGEMPASHRGAKYTNISSAQFAADEFNRSR